VLANDWGGPECWGTGADKEVQWRKVLESGTCEGEEMKCAWAPLTRQAEEAAEWLNKETDPVFTSVAVGLGNGSTTGETRRKVMEAVERTRALLLAKALKLHRPQRERAA
jgi:hypothetical protein